MSRRRSMEPLSLSNTPDTVRARFRKSMTSTPVSGNLSLPYSPDRGLFDFSAISRHSSRLYKVIIIGEVATGKSALIKRYVHNHFSNRSDYRATVGVDFQLKMLKFNDDLEIRLQLWDIAGQERFSSMTRAYYKGAVGAIIVFDHSDARTFHAALERWKPDLDNKIRLPGTDKKIPVALVCNKTDKVRDPRLPSDLEISTLVQEKGLIHPWIKTSAKTGHNVKDAFNLIVRYIMAVDTWNPPMLDPDGSFDTSVPGLNPKNTSSDDSAKAEEAVSVDDEDIVNLHEKPSGTLSLCFC